MQKSSVTLWLLCSLRRPLGPKDAMELKHAKLPVTWVRAACENETEDDLNEYKIKQLEKMVCLQESASLTGCVTSKYPQGHMHAYMEIKECLMHLALKSQWKVFCLFLFSCFK